MKRKYLVSVVMLIMFLVGKVTGKRKLGKTVFLLEKVHHKDLATIATFNLWIQQKQSGHMLESFFERNDFHEIAIYGMGYLGERLLDDLRESRVRVKYGIDRREDIVIGDTKIVSPDLTLEKVDAIVVTPVFYFDEIKKDLILKVDCPIISLDDVLGNL